MRRKKCFAQVGATAAGLALVGLSAQSVVGHKRPESLGLHEGKLLKCPRNSRNCVCSETDEPSRLVAPFQLAVAPDMATRRIAEVIRALPRTNVVTVKDEYLHAEFTSRIFRFVDDLEIRIDPAARKAHVRSASRVGQGDLGVNRRRVEDLRQRLAQAGIIE